MSAPPPVPSGWFPDPLGRYDHRYFNGSVWTSDVSRDGQRLVDPMGTSPGAGSGGSPEGSNTAATAAVVMGSIALLLALIPFIAFGGAVLAVLAIVFGVKGLRRARTVGRGRGAAVAGTTMGALGVVLSVVGMVFTVLVWNEVVDFVEPGNHAIGSVDCLVDDRDAEVTGTITNESGSERGYVVFVDVAGASTFVEIDDVAPGSTESWATALRLPSVATVCEPEIVVHGPFPYGFEIDPVNPSTTP